ncbi:MAG: pectinesterase family protein [Chitinophagaceae bacterium]
MYKEKLVLAECKTLVTFIRESVEKTILSYDDYNQKKNWFGEEKGTSGSAGVYIYGTDFSAENTGEGANTTGRVTWSHQLTDAEATYIQYKIYLRTGIRFSAECGTADLPVVFTRGWCFHQPPPFKRKQIFQLTIKNIYMERTIPFYFLVFFPCLLISPWLSAQQPAFPGAEGAGRFTTGGRGTALSPTTVFEVTSLTDDNNPGSLRYALTQAAAYRTVVFRVSGTIHLNTPLRILRANTTIAGQTAPGDGICIADHPVSINANNVIVRYIRFRMGDKNQNMGIVNGSGGDDTFGAIGYKNIMVDHCSMSWSSDEVCTIYRGDSTTLQWNIISEPLNYSYHFETGDTDFESHGYDGIWGGRTASFHHNLIAHCLGRTPRFDGSRNLPPNTPGQENADFRNNVIYNWGSYNVNGGEGGNYNIVNNYYKSGPSTSSGSSSGVPIRYEVINPGRSASAPVLPYGKYYATGNYVDGSVLHTDNNWRGAAMSGGTLADTVLSKVETPFDIGPVTTQSAQEAYDLVLQNAGVVLPKRDTLDERIVNDVRNRTGRIIDVQGGYPHGTPYEQTVNAWPALSSTLPPADDDHNGMPNGWEISQGLNPNDAGDRNGYNADGYTNLERYLNTITRSGSNPAPPPGTSVIVAQDGSGDYTTIQAAINAAPTGGTTPYIIFIRNGKYKEKIFIPSNKPFLQLIGESVANTILTYNDGASTPLPGGGTVGTFNSYSVYVNANDFTAINITFENSFGDGSQAVAVHVNADRAAFKNCRFLGNQDTLLTNGNAGLRQYFKNCYIDGNVDFIFGSVRAIFDSCIIYAKTRTAAGNSFITAANTQAGQPYGYVFRNCIIPANTGGTAYFLGRPWQNSSGSSPVANNKVVFLNTRMGYTIRPEGWTTWDAGTNTSLIYYGEYKSRNIDGSLADVSQRVPWSYQLTDAEAATYTNDNLFGNWDPCGVSPDFCIGATPDIAIANFRGIKGPANAQFIWNVSWPMQGIRYQLFRSTDKIFFSPLAEVTAANDTNVNFQLTDPIPPPGSTYYYILVASKQGFASHTSDTISISSTPTINAPGTLGNFIQGVGLPSAVQAYTVSGENLGANVVITPPPGYEVSPDGGTTWYDNSSLLTLHPINTTLAAVTITVRLNAGVPGSYAGNIVHTSTGAVTISVAVNGTVQSDPLPVSNVLVLWPFSIKDSDSAAVRSPGVSTAAPTLSRLYLSNGQSGVPPYSSTQGQGLSASANGDGTWTTASGGPGGNLSRTLYEKFTVTALSGYSIKVDSLILNASFYLTLSNTKLAVVYSLSGFANDSTDITGGSGLGNPLMSGANGAFATPILLLNENGPTTHNYRLALNSSAGVMVGAGQTLTVRVYFSCGSGSAGRYAKLKDVHFKGLASQSLPLSLLSFRGSYDNPSARLWWSTSQEINTRHFIVQKSLDAQHFTTIGKVPSKNTVGINQYSFADPAVLAGPVYYRLQMVDLDGKFTFSDVIVLHSSVTNLMVYPNPAQASITILHAKADGAAIAIYNAKGAKLVSLNPVPGTSSTILNISVLAKGHYTVIYSNNSGTAKISFIKQ